MWNNILRWMHSIKINYVIFARSSGCLAIQLKKKKNARVITVVETRVRMYIRYTRVVLRDLFR